MHVVKAIEQVRAIRWAIRGHLGTGPDDGALHAGHLSLVQRARARKTCG